MANTPYYAEVLRDWGGRLGSLSDFARLPILTRAVVSERGDELVSRERPPDFLRNTSGSTFSTLGRRPMVTFHMLDEVEFAGRLEEATAGPRPSVQPLMLRVLSLDHGVDVTGSVSGIFAVPLANFAHFRHVLDLLGRSFAFTGMSTRVEGLVGTLTRLKILTVLCQREGITQDAFDVRFIGCHSQLLTERWRRLIRAQWGVEPTDIYGISEIPGLIGARCETCGHFHLSARAFIELVDPVTYEPVHSGLARVVATTLYPLVRAQPLIRYDTEDLVEVHPPCPGSKRPAVEYAGRAGDVATLRSGDRSTLLLGPLDVAAVLDEEPAVAIAPSPLAGPFDLGDEVGALRYLFRHSVDGEALRVELYVELRWDPRLYPEEADRLRARVCDRLEAVAPRLGPAQRAGRAGFEVRLLAPGSLETFTDA